MIVLSPLERNIDIILQGDGLCPLLFENSETLDNGQIYKFLYFIYFKFKINNHLPLTLFLCFIGPIYVIGIVNLSGI